MFYSKPTSAVID